MSTAVSEAVEDFKAPLRRAPRLTEAEIYEAADTLLMRGERPTIDRVRVHLGRGSPNTINDCLDRWWKRLGARLSALPAGEFPQLPASVGRSLQSLWQLALEAAQEQSQGQLAERETLLEQRREALERQAIELAQKGEQIAAQVPPLETALQLAREQLTAANRRAETLESTLAERDAELVRNRKKVEALENELRQTRSRLEDERKAHKADRIKLEERQDVTEKRWTLEVDRARQQAKDTAKERDELKAKVGKLAADVSALQNRVKKAKDERQQRKLPRQIAFTKPPGRRPKRKSQKS